MKELNKEKTISALNEILKYEPTGVVKYTHFFNGYWTNELSLNEFFKEQAEESLEHAQQAGELLTGLGGHPSQAIPKIEETNQHSIENLLKESLAHEEMAIDLYKNLLDCWKIKAYTSRSMLER